MELREIKLHNFRCYKDIHIKFSEGIQMQLGKNDIGKSSIFEALDIFFNDKDALTRLSVDDLNINASRNGETDISVTCIFELSGQEDIRIETVKINPAEEFILNSQGYLEITKEWDTTSSTLKCTTYINCNLPTCIPCEIMTAKQGDLKKYVKERSLEDEADLTTNSLMRKTLYEYYIKNDSEHSTREIKIQTKSALGEKDILENISKSFPAFYLFKADRKNSTSDDEVQNPMSIAVKHAFEREDVKEKIKDIESIVRNELDQVNECTIAKLEEMNVDYGNKLKPRISANWANAIKNDITDGNGIPINKRGSGIRRLLLLSYLMVEAEKESFERGKKDIIYAIEEPETALHPYMQKIFISQLIKLSLKNRYEYGDETPDRAYDLNHYQIFMTTHLPNYAGYAQQQQIVYLYADNDGNVKRYMGDDLIKYIQDNMGTLPVTEYKYVIFVEGENDVNALQNFGKIPELKSIFDVTDRKIAIIPLIGSNLIKCMEMDYYWDLPVKQYHLYDNDVQKYRDIISERCNRPDNMNVRGRVTTLREMENYIPKLKLECDLGVELSGYDVSQWRNQNFDIVELLLSLPDTTKEQFTKIKNMNNSHDKKVKALKNYLNKTVLLGVSKAMLEEHGVYEEIKEWFEEMKRLKEYRGT